MQRNTRFGRWLGSRTYSIRSRLLGRIALTIATSAGILAIVSATAFATGVGQSAGTHVVQRGQSLWQIAADRSRGRSSAAQIASAVRRIAAINADRLPRGNDFVLPGQRLRVPARTAEQRRVARSTRSVRAVAWSAGPVREGTGLARAEGSSRVREVQSRLACLGYASGPIDGRFGPRTRAAVRRFQARASLAVDGVVGNATLRALRGACSPPPSTSRTKAKTAARKASPTESHSTALARVVPTSRPARPASSEPVPPVLIWLSALTAALAFTGLAVIRRDPGHRAGVSSAPAFARANSSAGAARAGSPLAPLEYEPPILPVSVVIPTLDEVDNLEFVLERLPDFLTQIVVVDGGSADGTREFVQALRPDVQVIGQSGRGKGNALACGFAKCWGDIIVKIDADGSTDPAEIPRFVDALVSGASFAKGSRFIRGGGSAHITPLRRASNRALSMLVNWLFETRYTDPCCGYNAFWRRALPSLGLDGGGVEVETLMNIRAAKAGLEIVEVPTFECSRSSGAKKKNARRDGLRILRTIIAERRKSHGAQPARPARIEQGCVNGHRAAASARAKRERGTGRVDRWPGSGGRWRSTTEARESRHSVGVLNLKPSGEDEQDLVARGRRPPVEAGTLRVVERRGRDVLARQDRRRSVVRRTMLAVDVVVLVLVCAAVDVMSLGGVLAHPGESAGAYAGITGLVVALLAIHGLYARDDVEIDHTTTDDLGGILHSVMVAFFVVCAAGWLLSGSTGDLPAVTVGTLAAGAGVASGRAVARIALHRIPSYEQRTLIVGAGGIGQLVARKLLGHPEYGLRPVGFVDDFPRALAADVSRIPVVGRLDDLGHAVRANRADRVMLAFSSSSHQRTLEAVRIARDLGVHVDIVPRLFEALGPSAKTQSVEGLPLLSLPPMRLGVMRLATKRAIDIAMAGALLILLAPMAMAIAALIKLHSQGPIFYAGQRIGARGRPFAQLKFRTMRVECCSGPGYGGATADVEFARLLSEDPVLRTEFELTQKLSSDPRVTPIGAWLRKTSLDELPQLLNVLRGDMSIVGPRPITERELRERYQRPILDPTSSPRLVVGYWDTELRPGLTGYWQISGRSTMSFEERVRLDNSYLTGWSLLLDLQITARTLRALLTSRGAY